MTATFDRGERKGRRAEHILRVSVLCVLCGLHIVHAQQPPPSFQTSVDVTSLDVTVVDERGKPVAGLTPADFTVRIDGNARRVVTAEWIPLAAEPSSGPVVLPPDGYSTNESATGGRLIVMGIDQPNIRFGGAMAIARAANAFIDRLAPSDRVAVAGFGIGAPATTFTADRARIKQAISRMVGQKQARLMDLGHNIALVEAQAIDKGDRAALDAVQGRECQGIGMSAGALEICRGQVEVEARTIAQDVTREAEQTLQTLRDLFAGLRRIDAPKTLILISEGFILSDEGMIVDLGTMAADARTSLYALKLDNQMFDIADARMPINPFADRQARSAGLELLAGAARGTLFTVTGTGQALFERIESELSGYYLLGVESEARDKDGRSHSVRIDVPRRGATVRSRRQVVSTSADQHAARASRSPRQAVVAALGSPLLASALPLRVASFALQGPELDKVQLLIHADVGTDYPASKVVSVGYVITDRDGRLVDSKSADMRLLPTMTGVPSALQYTAGASLAPGEYTLKLAAIEGERVGTVEHTIHATLPESGGVTLSELMVGGPLDVGNLLTPTIGYQITFGSVHGYVEAYGAKTDGVTMEYEIATGPDAPALLNVDVPPHPVGDTRVIFTRVMPTHALPAGKYVLRAILSAGGTSIKTLTRGFEIAAPKVLLTSADGLSSDTSKDADLFLPVDEPTMTPPFKRDLAIRGATLAPFLERVAPSVKTTFDQGIGFLAAGDYSKAEASFKRAIDPDLDSTTPLTFLAACFAASGHDREAASAWQTALVEGTDFPQIYQWLGDALLRNHDFGEARAIFEEAAAKWPNDVRFTKPLAMLYGTFGKGREAVRTLERYLEERQDDRDAYYFAVQWLYTLHAGGAIVHTRAEDLKRAKEYADAYARARGPQLALVKQWVTYLENEGNRP